MKQQEKTLSAALVFMQAARDAIPRTFGDRDRIEALEDALRLAVKNRFAFDRDDGPLLERLGIETSGGCFRPMDFYTLACASGGTYPRMWEQCQEQKPWIAARAVFPEWVNGTRQRTLLENNRVAVRAAVLLPATFTAEEPELASFEGRQVWWVTSQDDETITLCRYRVTDAVKARGAYYVPFERSGSPARVRKLSRADWTSWNDAVRAEVEKKAA
jgi:hypothetical protein